MAGKISILTLVTHYLPFIEFSQTSETEINRSAIQKLFGCQNLFVAVTIAC